MWLCEPVVDPKGNNEEKIPRIMLYTEGVNELDLAGYASNSESEKEQLQAPLFKPSDTNTERPTSDKSTRFCIECGSRLKFDSKFCTKCGTKQESIGGLD